MTARYGDWHGFERDVPVLPGRRVRIVFAVGALDRVAAEANRLGRRVLMVAGPHEDAAAERVATALGSTLAGRLRDVAQHVPADLAAAAVESAGGADVVVSIGGGSATGLAKAIALETALPILAVPTTYAGSEMTPIWGLTDAAGKRTGRDARVLPRTVVYDPMLTVSLPPDVTAASGMNAIAHAVESLYAPDVTAEVARRSVEGLRAFAAGLPVAVQEPGDLSGRRLTMYGAWLAGWALGATTMGLHHKLAHVLGGRYRLPHAGTHSALLPQVTAFNATAAAERLAPAAAPFGGTVAADLGPALYDLASALQAPTSLAQLGLPVEAVDDVAAEVAATDVANPRAIDATGLRDLLLKAHAGTRP